jgi:hypothetical protein
VPVALQAPALHDDAPAWARAWQALDTGPVAQLAQRVGQKVAAQPTPPFALTLCGTQAARTWYPLPRSLWRRMGSALRRPSLATYLKNL